MAQMPFAKDNNMVKTIPPDRADESLRIPVLPWRPRRNRSIPYTHCSKPLDDDIAVDAIPIANDILRRLLPAVRFSQLTAIQWALGRAVTPNHRSSRRECRKIRNPYSSRN